MKYLVPYSGATRLAVSHTPTADSLFRLGYDTLEVAEKLRLTEAEVLRALSCQRSKRLGLPSPLERYNVDLDEVSQ